MRRIVSIRPVRPGTILETTWTPPFRWAGTHLGVFTGRTVNGKPTVIHNARRIGKVIEEDLTSFAQGSDIRVLGYPGSLSPSTVISRARSRLEDPWVLTQWNCEHFAFWAHGLDAKSPQARRGVLLMATFFGLGLVALRGVMR